MSTEDNLFLLKTLSNEETDLVRQTFLANYLRHRKRNTKTLISDIIGIYTLVLEFESVNVVLMRNIVGPFKPNVICNFDLKGSTIGRLVNLDSTDFQQVVMKDVNFEIIEKRLFLEETEKDRLIEQVTSDSKFLSEMNIMDYSLFVVKIELKENEVD